MEKVKPESLSAEQLKEWLLNIHETYYIELKKASELPNSFWESYSSFCNTSGGWIILGVKEEHPQNVILGVNNPEKALTSLWDQLSNTSKVSYRIVENQDVQSCMIDGKTVIIVHVKEAPESMKPVYIGGRYENTFIRTGDGDRKASKEEIASFMRNAQPGQDILAADGFTITDLDTDSLIAFKEKVSRRYPKQNYSEMSPEQFLLEIGASFKDRTTGEVKLKRGTLLFLGKSNAIKELYPHYHVDYFNRSGNNQRWSDRVSDDDSNGYEMNIYNFYTIVYEKMKVLLKEAFALDESQLRIPVSDFDETIRECLVNCLAHADYIQGYPSIRIDVYDGWFCFLNPGKMLVSKQQFFNGGDSRPRNEIIMKFFRLLGASERQGFGGPLIFSTAVKNDFRRPEIVSDIEHTEIKVWNIDLADSYQDLEQDAKTVLRCITKSMIPQSVNALRKALNMTEYKVRKNISTLEEKGLIYKMGQGPSTKYSVKVDSVEFLTILQMATETLKKQMS